MLIAITVTKAIQDVFNLLGSLLQPGTKVNVLNLFRNQGQNRICACPAQEQRFSSGRDFTWGRKSVGGEDSGTDSAKEEGESRGVEDMRVDCVRKNSI
jgi:hypothetical protein